MKQCLVILILLLSCAKQDGPKEKVIVVNIRGTSFEQIKNAQSGFFADAINANRLKSLRPVENAVTAVNMASFETGTYPSQHGIVGHMFANPEDKSKAQSGFNTLYETETYWEAASRNSLNVLNIGSLVMHGKKRVHANVDMIAQGQQKGSARFWDLNSKKIDENTQQFSENSDSKLQLNDSTFFYLFMQEINGMNILIFDQDEDLSNGSLFIMNINGWGHWLLKKDPFQISLRLRVQDWNAETGQLKLFARAPFMNRGKPADFVEHIENTIGPSTGWLSIPEYFSGKISDEILQEEIDQEVDYVMAIAEQSIKSDAYDLISIDYPLMDRYWHVYGTPYDSIRDHFVSSHGGPPIENDSNLTKYHKFRKYPIQRINKDLTVLTNLAKLNDYRIIVASSHGFSHIEISINLNALLASLEFKEKSDSKDLYAYPGKVSAHLYFNKNLDNERKEKLHRLLKAPWLTSIIEKVLSHNELKEVGLNHIYSGDFWILLQPGWVFQPQIFSDRPIFDEAMFRGDHGYRADLPESQGVIILDTELLQDNYHVTDIARLTKELLGIEE